MDYMDLKNINVVNHKINKKDHQLLFLLVEALYKETVWKTQLVEFYNN